MDLCTDGAPIEIALRKSWNEDCSAVDLKGSSFRHPSSGHSETGEYTLHQGMGLTVSLTALQVRINLQTSNRSTEASVTRGASL